MNIIFIKLTSLTLLINFKVRGQTLTEPPLINPHWVAEWHYWGTRGQSDWCCRGFPVCCGKFQSPINIEIRNAQYTASMSCLSVHNYDVPPKALALHNDAHHPQLVYTPWNSTTIPHVMIGSWTNGTGVRFELDRIIFHFGNESDRGSDHLLDGVEMPMEMQMIHRNTKYSTVAEAMNKSDGLIIVAVFFVVVPEDNPRLREVVYNLKYVVWKGEAKCLVPFPLLYLLPPSYGYYYTYYGSLTYPPCFESVTWVVFHNPVHISELQLSEFRRLQDETKINCPDQCCPLYNNFRKPVCVENRHVKWKEECAPTPKT